MFDSFMVPEKTVVSANGDGTAMALAGAQFPVLLLLLKITDTVEQESIDVSVWGAGDGQTWSAKPLASFPQAFYPGEYPLLLDLKSTPEIKFLRAHWEVNRWGRGPETPRFEFSLRLTEVAPEVLKARE